MQLRTLGGLELEGTDFARAKPLLLLAYLALEGAKERRFLAELFWPEAADKLNSLSRALSQIRKGAPGSIEADETRVWSPLASDARELLAAAAAGDATATVGHYRGTFLAGLTPSEWGLEIEEWVLETREELAAQVQLAHLTLAAAAAAAGAFGRAGDHAETAFTLEAAPEPEPEELRRYHLLLVAAERRLAERVRRQAADYGVALTLSTSEARVRLRTAFLGRERERERLETLPSGAWAWLRGAAGMGKTALLRSLSGTYLQGRSGLPYATLEPLLGDALAGASEAGLLRHLAGASGCWLIDSWEWVDDESKALLRRLRDLRPELKVVVASRLAPALRVDLELELGPLSATDLADHEGVHLATGGLPSLVAARLRGEPLEEALEGRLQAQSEAAAHTYLALALLDRPDPPLVRRALGLGAATMAEVLEELGAAGLVSAAGEPQALQAAREYLDTEPVLTSKLSLLLARELRGLEAYPLFAAARLLWEEGDLAAVGAAYRAWAEELLRRGFAQRATSVLERAPPGPEVAALRARALERSGRFNEALALLGPLEATPERLALESLLQLRLGRPKEARSAAERALDGEPAARAEALNTLGHLARADGDLQQAVAYAGRAAAVWRSLGNQARWAGALLNRATAETLLGHDARTSFEAALAAAGDNTLLRARVLLNLGWMRERGEDTAGAETAYREAAALAEQVGDLTTAARGWNNVGVLHHKGARPGEASGAYERALALAQQAGEQRMLGMFMANLAELSRDRAAWEEALRILERSGHRRLADEYRSELPANHPFRHEDHAQDGA